MRGEVALDSLTETIAEAFVGAGATRVSLDLLQPAGALLDLYGEDIRARAYTTYDPNLGEMMLRPDFTVPIVQRHMRAGANPARYTYSGPVFRVPPAGSGRPRDTLQVGYELFGQEDRAAADAEVFALFSRALAGFDLAPATGDMGILLSAIDSLETTARRRRALRRHLWRPRRFRALFDRFAGRADPTPARQEMVSTMRKSGIDAMVADAGPAHGLRDVSAVRLRLERLAEDADAPAIPAAQADAIDLLLDLRDSLPKAHATLRNMAPDLPGIDAAVDGMAQRMAALDAADINPDTLPFEASFGRTNMEYYDGFVFGFSVRTRPDLPAVATGGRYDALTAVLGQGTGIPAVGGVVRPEILAADQKGSVGL
ncbi:MAG: ATP phosphoribosyltransferase regulatory subunit [Pseudomonadota bacterium]